MKIQPLSLFLYYDTNLNNIELQYTIGVVYKMRNSYTNNFALLLIFSFFLITSDLLVSDLDMMLFISSCNQVRI